MTDVDALPVRELRPYDQQPPQMPVGIGKQGKLRMEFERRGERTSLVRLYRQAPLLVQQALYYDDRLPSMPYVSIITISGCVVQGDRYDVRVRVGPEAQAHITSQAATKVHEMDANYAAQTQRFALEEGAYLEVLPRQIIPHRHSRFVSTTTATVDPTATLLYGETLAPGRKHHDGEVFAYDLYAAEVRGERPDGRCLFTERLVVEPERMASRVAGVMGAYDAAATVVLMAPARVADEVEARAPLGLDVGDGCAAGTNRLPHDAGLLFKVLGPDVAPVRAVVHRFADVARQAVCGVPLPEAAPWR
jgi:urease accessory protein